MSNFSGYFCGLVFTALCLLNACKSMYNPKSVDYAPIIEITTNLGVMEVQLFASTPKHRDNFVKLVKQGFYDSLLFHRVIKDFMIQGGDPESKAAPMTKNLGMGGPGYTIPAEFKDDKFHIKGMLCAARMGDQMNPQKASSGSQFYLVQGKEVTEDFLQRIESFREFKYTEEARKKYLEQGGTPHLDQEYTVFGEIIKGLDVLDKIATQKCNNMNRPLENIWMKMRIKKG